MQAKYFVAVAYDVGDMRQSDCLYLVKLRSGRIAGYADISGGSDQDNVISVRAERVQPLFVTKAETVSHDFH